jgi:hypothetical protein
MKYTVMMLLACCLFVGGCDTGETVRQAETWHDDAVELRDQAEAALVKAEALAAQVENLEVTAAVTEARLAFERASRGVDLAGDAVEKAKEAEANGASWFQVIGAAVSSILVGLGGGNALGYRRGLYQPVPEGRHR